MKTFKQSLHDSGTGGYELIDILNNLTDEEIEDSVKDFAEQYATEAVKAYRERVLEELPDEELEYVDYYDFSKGVETVECGYKQIIKDLPIELP